MLKWLKLYNPPRRQLTCILGVLRAEPMPVKVQCAGILKNSV